MDTTAKVDIRKLQLLNDRIAQTIEALNQVRLSVHGLGLSHTAGNVQGGLPFQGGIPFGLQGGLQGGVPFALQGGLPFQGGVPFGHPMQNIGQHPGMLGIQHSSPYGYGGYPQQQLGFAQGGFPQGIGGWPVQNSIWGLPQQNIGGFGGGLAHTSPDVFQLQNQLQNPQQLGLGFGLDPYTAARIIQSFPFAQSAVPGLY